MVLLVGRTPAVLAQDATAYVRWIDEGERKVEAGDQTGAWADFIKARDSDPARPGAYVRLAMTALELKRRSEGLEALRKLRELRPDSVDDKDLVVLHRSLLALSEGPATSTGSPEAASPRGGILEAASAEAALNEAASAWQAGDRARVRQLGQEALEVLLPALRKPQEAGIEVWRAGARTALLLEDQALAAGAQAAIEKVRPDFATDPALLKLMADLNRLPNKPLLEDARKDFVAYTTAMLGRPRAGAPFINSLGMKFVPVPSTQVLFSVWETRVQDFEVFVKETQHDATAGMFSLGPDGSKQRGDSWKSPGFVQDRTHPVVGVSWEDAQAFCRWLSKKEGRTYRLPRDLEWSAAVGLPAESGATPKDRDAKIEDVFPWGGGFPPPADAGNFARSEARDANWPTEYGTIEGFRDGYARTSPVGAFKPNRHGIFDLGGNVWELCEDKYRSDQDWRVLRGGSWFTSPPRNLWSSSRDNLRPGSRLDDYGFRVVVVVESR
jgi:hypothetical protein